MNLYEYEALEENENTTKIFAKESSYEALILTSPSET